MCQRRVLLARIKGEVRQVQFCKWTTTIEGSLEPLCRLTHSIIQARRCRRVTMRSRSLVSTSNREYSEYWTVQLFFLFFASQTLRNIKTEKKLKKIRRSKRQRNFCLLFFASRES
jgi:hypothetical protein